MKYQISKIQSAFTICSAMCSRSAKISGIENNLASDAVEANTMKAYVTDLMQEAAQTLTQLSGANGYKAESMGSRAIIDTRPFQVFEGSNEMLYTQIYEMVQKLMIRSKEMNFADFLKGIGNLQINMPSRTDIGMDSNSLTLGPLQKKSPSGTTTLGRLALSHVILIKHSR